MGRLLVWCVVLLSVGGLTWFLLGADDVVPGRGTYDPAGAEDHGDEAKAEGPGLKTRDNVPLVVEPEPERGEAAIYGIVMDEDGKPLGGVKLGAAPRAKTINHVNERNRIQAMELFRAPTLPGKAVAFATSGPDGHFVIKGLMENDRYRVRAHVDAPAFSSSLDWNATLGKKWTVRVIVGQGTPFQGRIVDADGKGTQGWVTVSKQGTIGNRTYISGTWRPLPFQTKPDGRFTIPSVPTGTLLFKVAVLGRGSRSNIPADTPAEKEVELSFEDPSGATVTGRVIDTAGKGIAGAKVSVRSRPERVGGFASTTMRATTSAEDGSFTVNRLAPGVIQNVVVFAEGYVSPGGLGGGMPLTEKQPTKIDIILARGAVIQGRALDPMGQPVVGATIMATRVGRGYGGWNQQLAEATTDSEGKFVLTDVALGPGEIKAKADGYYQPPREGQASPYPWMPPPTGVGYDAKDEGQVLQKDVELARGSTITGTVKDENDKPASGVRITVSIASGGWYWGFDGWSKPALSAEDGTFKYEGLAPDKAYNVTAASETHMADPVKVTVPKEGDPKPIEIKLQAGGGVKGRVLEADGKPASGATVTCNYGNRSAITDATGAFEITGIKAGKWNVQVGNVSPLPASARQTVTVVAGEIVDQIELMMPVTLTIQGMVTDPDNKPVVGISVSARVEKKGRRRGGTFRATTDTKGHFEIKNVQEGYYTVWTGQSNEKGVSAGTDDLMLTYEEPERMSVEGRVFDPDGNPVARGNLRIWYGPNAKKRNMQASGTITGGYFRILVKTDETECDVEVTQAVDPTGRPVNYLPDRSKDHDLGANMEVKLTRGLELSGRVTDMAGAAVVGVQIRAQTKGARNNWYWGGGQNSARSDDEGNWTIKGLKEGQYQLTVTPGGTWITPDKRDVDSGQKDVEIKLMKGLAISGTILDPEGEPLANANVWLTETASSKASRGAKGGHDWMASQRLRKQTSADGTFEITGLPEDSLFNVGGGGNGKDQPFISETVKDVIAGTKDVTIQLGRGLLIEGEVFGIDGEPVRSAWVQARPADPRSGLRNVSTHLNRTHKFKLGPLQPGRYKITVQIHGNKAGNPEPQEVDAGARSLRFTAQPALTVTGFINGTDIKGFNVYFAGTSGNTTSTRAGADGSFTIKNVKNSLGKIFVNKPGDTRYGVLENVEAGAGPYTVELQEGLTIAGFVDNLPSEQKRRAQVYAYGNKVWISAKVELDGSFVITGLGPGKYTVQGWMSGGRINAQKNVEAGTEDVVLEFVSNKK